MRGRSSPSRTTSLDPDVGPNASVRRQLNEEAMLPLKAMKRSQGAGKPAHQPTLVARRSFLVQTQYQQLLRFVILVRDEPVHELESRVLPAPLAQDGHATQSS